MKQPLLIVALLYLGGILLGDHISLPLPLLFAVAFALTCTIVFKAQFRVYLLGSLVFLTGWINLLCHTAIISPHDLRTIATPQPELVTLEGTLIASPTQKIFEQGAKELWHSSALLKVDGLQRGTNVVPVSGRVLVTTPGLLSSDAFAGQHAVISGILRPIPGPLAEGLFDPRTFYRRKGIYFQLQASADQDWQILSTHQLPISDRFFQWAKHTLALGVPDDEALRLTETLMLDWKTPMTEEIQEPFVRAGTYHIFAVDGLRIGMIAAIALAFFRLCQLRREYCGLIIIPMLWFYTGLTGWPASAVRASVMMTVVILGWTLHRPSNLLNSLYTAAFILLLWDPQQIFQPGFQMSFFVVLCIGLLLPVFEKVYEHIFFGTDPYLPRELKPRWPDWLEKPTRWLLALTAMSTASWLGSIPLCAYYFNLFTPISTPANILVVPATLLAVISGLGSLLFGAWLPAVSEILNYSTWFWMKGIIVLSRWFAAWSPGYIYVQAPGLVTIALYYLPLLTLLTGWIFRDKFKPIIWTAIAILGVTWIFQHHTEKKTARVYVLNLHGSCALFAPAYGVTQDWLLDCGDANSANRITTPFLHAQGLNHLANLCLTIGHQQHMDGAENISTNFNVKYIYTGYAHGRAPAWRRLVAELSDSKRWEKIAAGDTPDHWQVLHPEALEDFTAADDKALVLRRQINGVSLLALSDLGQLGQETLLKRHPDLRADIIVAGLPEKEEPLRDEVIDSIHPKLIVLVDSDYPPLRRAPEKLRARLARHNLPVLYTRETGAITLEIGKIGFEARDPVGTVLFQE